MSKQIGCPDYWIGSRRIDHVRHQLQADAGVVLAGHAAVITSRIKTKQGTVKNISALGMHVNGDHEKTSVVGGRLIVLIN